MLCFQYGHSFWSFDAKVMLLVFHVICPTSWKSIWMYTCIFTSKLYWNGTSVKRAICHILAKIGGTRQDIMVLKPLEKVSVIDRYFVCWVHFIHTVLKRNCQVSFIWGYLFNRDLWLVVNAISFPQSLVSLHIISKLNAFWTKKIFWVHNWV